jgi:hypothetical protein
MRTVRSVTGIAALGIEMTSAILTPALRDGLPWTVNDASTRS